MVSEVEERSQLVETQVQNTGAARNSAFESI